MNKKIISILIVLFLAGAFGMAFLANTVHKKPEVEFCKSFLIDHDSFPLIGTIDSVEYDRMQAQRYGSSFTDNTTHGFYHYKVMIDGTERLLRVYWKNTKQGDDFQVSKIELVMGSDKPKVIYKK